MKRLHIREVGKDLHDKKVYLAGFVQEIKDLANVKFMILRDNSGTIQIAAPKSKVSEELFKQIPTLQQESVVGITGTVNAKTEAKAGIEILLEELKVFSLAAPELPIPVVERDVKTTYSKKLDFRSVELRKPRNQAIFNVQSALLEGMREWMLNDGFIQVFTPCIMGVPSESGSEAFNIDYYGKPAFLRQDPQLHRQLTIAGGFEKIFDIGPGWRAEKSNTTKHLCEHRVVAAEFAYMNDEADAMRVQEDMMVATLKKVKEKCGNDLEVLGVDFKIPKTPFPELRFPEIYDILEKMGKKVPRGEAPDTEGDKLLWEYVQKKYKAEFYWFNRFPMAAKPFYVMAVDEEPEWARSIDLNFRGLELSSGGQREHRYDKIVAQVKEKGMKYETVEWFAKFFQWGCPPHGGFAIGLERLTQALLNLENIRDAVLFPRDQTRVVP